MKKYELFDEHKKIALYGETPKEALERKMMIPQKDKYIKDGKLYGDKLIADYEPQEDIIVNAVLGEEDASLIKRGDKEIHRMICDTSIGIIAIDMHDTQTEIMAV